MELFVKGGDQKVHVRHCPPQTKRRLNVEQKTAEATQTDSAQAPKPENNSTPRRRKSSGETGKKIATRKSQKNSSELRLEAVRVLTNLPEDGRFFLIVEAEEGTKEIIASWN